MPILKGTGNTLLHSRFGYGKRISTRAKSVNSEHRHQHLDRAASAQTIIRGTRFGFSARIAP